MDISIHALLAMVAAIFFLATTAYRIFRPSAKHRRHHRKQQTAKRVLTKINSIPLAPQRLAYLRKIDPLAFEELLLETFELRGFQVTRSTRYSGDGGVDGIVTYQGETFLVQAKRYSKHINRKHMEAFCAVLEQRGCRGFFCHTGKTGAKSRDVASTSNRVIILSGQKLIDFLTASNPAGIPKGA